MEGAARAMGNTEEALVKANYGLAERGVGTGTFDHRTGAGHVHEHIGEYHDCIHTKRNTFLLLISEIFGGVSGRGVRALTRFAHQAARQSDTVHLDNAGRVVAYYHYHACAVSGAAAFGHGEVLLTAARNASARAAAVRATAPLASHAGVVQGDTVAAGFSAVAVAAMTAAGAPAAVPAPALLASDAIDAPCPSVMSRA